MTKVQLIDGVFLAAAAVVPILIVRRFRGLIGFVVAALFPWVALFVAGVALSAMDPGRSANMLDAIWLLLGWLPSALYALFLRLVVFGVFSKTKPLA